MKDYIKLIIIFLLLFASINLERAPGFPRTFAYIFCALILIFGYMAYTRYKTKYVKTMYITSVTCQLVFCLAIPYWVLNQGMALNAPWPYFPEVLWTTGSLVFWYYIISFAVLPVIVFLFGRRAWCSFICSTGTLAETLGDKYRNRGSKSSGIPKGFSFFKWLVVIATLAITLLTVGNTQDKLLNLLFLIFFILFLRTLLMLAVNIILMPKLGTRIWCKYFCPQGLLIALISRIGRFALVKDESLCANCGTCNKNCSMSVDVAGGPAVNRSGECVGCGICVELCPQKALSMTNNLSKERSKTKEIQL